ncbi:MAG: hypothetical protein AUJ49_07145 [Desulfovibrionaceae bacterium CG1_02_65_16]|nr:MAG: hypothetical protein AUJ49_07145 [Desulfovibrionaceae bacterium CG1_02_65_16]
MNMEVIDEGEYGRVTLTGNFPGQIPEAIDAFARISAAVGALGLPRVLLDVRTVGGRMSIPGTFEFVTMAHPDDPGTIRTACLDSPVNMTSARFYENLMQNRGRVYRMFTDEASALAWLLSDNP